MAPSNEFLVTSLHQFENICSFGFSIPSKNACVKRVYSIMGLNWRDERYLRLPETVKADLQIKIDYNLSCEEFDLSIK